MNLNWLDECANRRLLEITGPTFHGPRTAGQRTAETSAAQKATRLNAGERPESLDPLALRLKLRARETGIEIEADDVRAFIGEVKARRGHTADVDEAIEYLEGHSDIYKAVAAYCEPGWEEEARVWY
jgi:hypothetical protein